MLTLPKIAEEESEPLQQKDVERGEEEEEEDEDEPMSMGKLELPGKKSRRRNESERERRTSGQVGREEGGEFDHTAPDYGGGDEKELLHSAPQALPAGVNL